jgi:hypothetical protein
MSRTVIFIAEPDTIYTIKNRGRNIGRATGYGLGCRGFSFRIPVGQRLIPSRRWADSEAHPASYPMATEDLLAVTDNRSTTRHSTYIVFLRSVSIANSANVLPSSTIHVTVMMEAISSSKTPFLTRGRRYHIPEYGILHSHCRENLKSYIALTG